MIKILTMTSTSSKSRKRFIAGLIRYLLLSIGAMILLLPLVWGGVSSLKPTNELFELPIRLFPAAPTIENYVESIRQGFALFLFNSFRVSVLAVILALVIGTVAAYVLARINFRGRKAVLWLVLFTMMVPGLGSLIPTYLLMSALQLVDSYVGLVLAYTALNLPLAVWILRSFFLTLPDNLEQAAIIDGCGPFRTFTIIMLPLVQPGIAAVAIFGFLMAWNDHLLALTLISSKSLRTIPLAIYYTLGDQGTDWGLLTSGAMLSIVPTVLVYLSLQRHFVSGLTTGSIKG